MSLTLRYPLPAGVGVPTDGFGWRAAIPGVIDAMLHDGQDYAAPEGTPILAAHDGLVTFTGWDPTGGGWMVRLEGEQCTTLYLHQPERTLYADPGELVHAGDRIGTVGATGAATGAHLHFTLILADGTRVDPRPYITYPPATLSGDTPMLLAYYAHAAGKGRPRWAFFGPGFWLEIKSRRNAETFKRQLGMKAVSFKCGSEAEWAKFKTAAQGR